LTPFNSEIFRFGTAAWAAREELKKDRVHRQTDNSLFLGFYRGKPIYHNSDAPLTTIAGSGAGKFTKVVAWNLCLMAGTVIAFDPKAS
jgi:type IV secretion system protein VirD4